MALKQRGQHANFPRLRPDTRDKTKPTKHINLRQASADDVNHVPDHVGHPLYRSGIVRATSESDHLALMIQHHHQAQLLNLGMCEVEERLVIVLVHRCKMATFCSDVRNGINDFIAVFHGDGDPLLAGLVQEMEGER